MKRPLRLNRYLRCESLEPRRLLAGDVSVNVNNAGHLIIRGDELSNAIQVEADLLPGSYTITGLADDQSVGTTVNGQGSVTVSGVTGDIRIQLNEGNDWLNMGQGGPLSIAVDLRIGTDGGDDVVDISNVTVGGSAVIQLGDGFDGFDLVASSVVGDVAINGGQGGGEISPGVFIGNSMEVVDTVVGGSLAIHASGVGSDEINVDMRFLHAPVSIGGNLTINTGGGFDVVNVRGGELSGELDGSFLTSGNVTIHLGADGDTLNTAFINVAGNLDIRGGDGTDNITLDQKSTVHGTSYLAGNADVDQIVTGDSTNLIGDVTIVTGGDGDLVGLQFSTFGNVTITTGAGADTVIIISSHFTGNLTIDTGGGNDTVIVQDSVFDSAVAILLGTGDDEFDLLNSTFLGSTTFNGGRGTDNMEDQGGNTFASTPTTSSWEA